MKKPVPGRDSDVESDATVYIRLFRKETDEETCVDIARRCMREHSLRAVNPKPCIVIKPKPFIIMKVVNSKKRSLWRGGMGRPIFLLYGLGFGI